MLVILALEHLWQKDCEFQASLDYIVREREEKYWQLSATPNI
jgi:hypothetical protein